MNLKDVVYIAAGELGEIDTGRTTDGKYYADINSVNIIVSSGQTAAVGFGATPAIAKKRLAANLSFAIIQFNQSESYKCIRLPKITVR